MKAVVVHGAADLRIDEQREPQAGAGQVVVGIVYGGICGSDLHYAAAGRNGNFEVVEPLTVGHEVSGIVTATGPDVDPGLLGRRVAIHPAIPTPPVGGPRGSGLNLAYGGSYLGSASTHPHTQGGFAESLVVTVEQLRPLPDALPLRRAALAEPLAVAIHAVGLLGSRVSGARVLVSGAGPIGLLAVAALKNAGAAHIVVTDLQEAPLAIAGLLGADEVVRIGADAPLGDDGFDLVVEAAGVVPSLVTALRTVRRGGAILQLGILPAGDLSIPLASLVAKELLLQGTQRFDVEIDEAIELLLSWPELEAVVTHEFAADEAQEAFVTAADSSHSSKVLLRFRDDPDRT